MDGGSDKAEVFSMKDIIARKMRRTPEYDTAVVTHGDASREVKTA